MSLFNRIIILFLPLVPKAIVKIFSKPYIAGVHLQDAIFKVKQLNRLGASATIDVLGEGTKDRHKTEQVVNEYLVILDAIQR